MCDTGREQASQGRIWNDVVLVLEEPRIQADLTDYLAGVHPELAQEGTDFTCNADADHTFVPACRAAPCAGTFVAKPLKST